MQLNRKSCESLSATMGTVGSVDREVGGHRLDFQLR